MNSAEVYAHFSALEVSLVRAGEYDAARALIEWAQEWLPQLEELDELLDELEEEAGA